MVSLTHLGMEDSNAQQGHRSIDMYENTKGIDIVLDGHSHSVMTEAKNGEPIQSTGTKFAYVGVVVIDDKAKEVEDHYLVSTDNLKEEKVTDEGVTEAASKIITEVDAKYAEKIG